ncbi:hypothetical protein EZJ43_15715 [Pedobacter changchengzhani]|uniref:Peptidase M60 domain-containing protein n=1 Tax=Pedobacter changchengzhani TaxID=2529274 RepID=A0A4R5MHL4_9SPHI|nr:M60 family metallopeptidase [Pedobacter changchengzhani]TDG35014.1 hypothetical protein EZJ43_15715 [Pedobacter changchengzhani]
MKFKIFCTFILIISCQALFAQQDYTKILLKNVVQLPLPDSGSYVSIFFTSNEKPQILATAKFSGDIPLYGSVIMASTLDKGKIIAFGSSAYLKENLISNTSVSQLLQNCINWQTNNKKKPKLVIYKNENSALQNFLKKNRLKANVIKNFKLLKKADVVFLNDDVVDSSERKLLENYLRAGGNLIFASPYNEIFKNRDTTNSYTDELIKINDVLEKSGIFNAYTLLSSSAKNNMLSTNEKPFYLHINTIISELANPAHKEDDEYQKQYYIMPTIAMSLFSNTYDSPLINKIKSTFKTTDSLINPTPEHPIDVSTIYKRWRYYFSTYIYQRQHNKNEQPNFVFPASKIFPGEVADSTKRSNEKLSISIQVGSQGLSEPNPVYYRLHSTGFYVQAGGEVKIILNKTYLPLKLKAQIGIHSDDLLSTDITSLTRMGIDLTKTFEITSDTTMIASPYGGLLYINIPDTTKLKSLTLKVNGIVKAPYFKLNEVTDQAWKSIRNNPAPWAELATDNIILTVPSYRIRNLQNPSALMKFWNEVMDADADLAIIDRKRTHPERVIVDRQVAYGYMFTQSNKIVVPDDESCEWMLDEKLIREKGSWGLFHELGHRHQFWGLDMDEVGEVTCNLYSMYIFDKVLKKGIYNHENISNKEAVLKRVKNYLDNKPDFKKWGEDPFTALCMYIQIIENFGWKPILDANEIYRKIDPKTYNYENALSNQQRIDLWFTTICKTTNSNLSSFFEVWKIPISDVAKAETSGYKKWFPNELGSYLSH